MGMRESKFTDEQIKELLNNKFVRKCSNKTVSFTPDFKVFAVKRYEDEGLTASRIFEEAGFCIAVIGQHVPDNKMSKWRKIFRAHGAKGLLTENRGKGGGRPRTNDLTDASKIERLEATVAYLKAENAFLAKLRAKRTE